MLARPVADALLSDLVMSIVDRKEFVQWCCNMCVPSRTVSPSRACVWSLTGARVLLALRQTFLPCPDLPEGIHDTAIAWALDTQLPQATYGAGLILCA